MLGDSITEWKALTMDENGSLRSWEASIGYLYNNARVFTFARSGWTTDDVLENIDRIENYISNNTIAFILIGINDLIESGKSPEQIFNNIEKITLFLIRKKVKPVFQTVLPTSINSLKIADKIIQINSLLKAYAQDKKLPLIDLHLLFLTNDGKVNEELFTDGLHLNARGYRKWIDEGIKVFFKSVMK